MDLDLKKKDLMRREEGNRRLLIPIIFTIQAKIAEYF